MKRNLLLLIVTIAVSSTLLVGCFKSEEKVVTPAEKPMVENQVETPKVDAVTSPSIATDVATLQKAMGKDGSWIVLFKCNINTDRELVLEGEFTKPDNNKMEPAGRKIAIYDRNAEKVVTEKYTLVAPKLIIKSSDATIQGGKFVGDIYVEAHDFAIKDVEIDGNVYFSTQAIMESFDIEEGATVTGVQEVK